MTPRKWLLALCWLVLASGCSTSDGGIDTHDAGELHDSSTDVTDGSVDAPGGPSGLPGECTVPVFFDPYDVQGPRTPTQLVACFGDNRLQAVRVDLLGSPVSGRLDEPCTPGYRQSECQDECESDADCGQGRLCTGVGRVSLSGSGSSRHGTQCLPAECTSPADCGGYACGVSFESCGVIDGYHCRSAQDECYSDLDCDEIMTGCRYLDGRFRCALKTTDCE